jgi:hypothetical protein
MIKKIDTTVMMLSISALLKSTKPVKAGTTGARNLLGRGHEETHHNRHFWC